MVKTTLTHDRSQAGFTLVELAIVMIIIGLLIGGILKGQELIANAQVTATASQVKSVEAALNTFDDSYSAMPGDMINPDTRLPGCTGPCAIDGTGNGRITETPAEANADGDEATRFWIQLATADLLGGINPAATTVAWGEAVPAADIGGGFTMGYAGAIGDLVGAVNNAFSSGHYISMRQEADTAIAASNANANLKPTQAARIDRKIDDGAPNAGTVRGAGGVTCRTANADGTYVESTPSAECQLYVRIRQ